VANPRQNPIDGTPRRSPPARTGRSVDPKDGMVEERQGRSGYTKGVPSSPHPSGGSGPTVS
jgi:hypothetical protein